MRRLLGMLIALILTSGTANAMMVGYARNFATTPAAPSFTNWTSIPAPLTATWGTSAGATSYNLYVRAGSAPTKSTYDFKFSGVTSPYSVNGVLTEGTTYYAGVTAVGSNGESSMSDTRSAIAAAEDHGSIVESTPGIYSHTFTSAATVTVNFLKGAGGGGGDPNEYDGGSGDRTTLTYGANSIAAGGGGGGDGGGGGSGYCPAQYYATGAWTTSMWAANEYGGGAGGAGANGGTDGCNGGEIIGTGSGGLVPNGQFAVVAGQTISVTVGAGGYAEGDALIGDDGSCNITW